jgi:hypothetical protein
VAERKLTVAQAKKSTGKKKLAYVEDVDDYTTGYLISDEAPEMDGLLDWDDLT